MKLSILPTYIKSGIVAGITIISMFSVSIIETFFDVPISRPAMIHEVNQLEKEVDRLTQENANLKTAFILLNSNQNNTEIIKLILTQ